MIDALKRFFMVAVAEWKLFYTDAAAVLLLVVAGVLYAFYYPMPYKYQTVSKIPVAVVDMDHSKLSRELVQMAEKYMNETFKRYDFIADETKEGVIIDENGGEYLDFLGGIAVNSVGGCNTRVVEAIKAVRDASRKHLYGFFHLCLDSRGYNQGQAHCPFQEGPCRAGHGHA